MTKGRSIVRIRNQEADRSRSRISQVKSAEQRHITSSLSIRWTTALIQHFGQCEQARNWGRGRRVDHSSHPSRSRACYASTSNVTFLFAHACHHSLRSRVTLTHTRDLTLHPPNVYRGIHLQEHLNIQLQRTRRKRQLKLLQHLRMQNAKSADPRRLARQIQINRRRVAGEVRRICAKR